MIEDKELRTHQLRIPYQEKDEEHPDVPLSIHSQFPLYESFVQSHPPLSQVEICFVDSADLFSMLYPHQLICSVPWSSRLW